MEKSADVYFVIPGDLQTPSGGYKYDRRLIQGLRERGLQVAYIPLKGRFPDADAQTLVDAATCFAALPSDALVLVDGLAYGVMDSIAQEQSQRLRLIALCHHPLSLESGLSAQRVAALYKSEKAALKAARAIIVTSQNTANTLTAEFDIEPQAITVAMPGTDPQSYAHCNNDIPVLLSIASLTRRKAHDVLLAAFTQLRHLPWRARWVGSADFDQPWSAHLREQCQHLGLQARIEFVGEVEDTGPEYLAADAFVLPSRYEGYGMAFAEALSFGLPIVAARSAAVPSVVPPSAGLLVPPDDSKALAVALESILDTSTRQRFRAAAQAAARDLPRWSDTAAKVAELIKGLQADLP